MPQSLASRILVRLKNSFLYLRSGLYFYEMRTYDYHRLHFSQEGEDILLERMFPDKQIGFYVDIGAHHPQRFSNTYKFYLKGWRGINIDPIPGIKSIFDELRPRDINLEFGISDQPGHLTYYIFNETALNTFDLQVANDRQLPIIASLKINVRSLSDVLSEFLPSDQHIDFLTIDVEGLDLNVLKSNDWQHRRPTYVLVESLKMADVEAVLNTELCLYMASNGYRLASKLFNTIVFEDLQAICVTQRSHVN
jgi:FkbM family methyltransferase